MQPSRSKGNPIVWIFLLTVITIATMLYSLNTSQNISKQYVPLIDAIMKIKYEATTAHLWLEETMSGDRYSDIEDIWKKLDTSMWYAKAILDGGENEEGAFVPIGDEGLRSKIEATIESISKFRVVADERFKLKSNLEISGEIEKHFNKIYNDFLFSADQVKTVIQSLMKDQIEYFENLQYLLVLVIFILGSISSVFLFRHEKRHECDMIKLLEKEEDLRITLNSIGDAVITTDKRCNIVAMNPIAEYLTGWKVDEAIGEKLSNVFNIINAHTREIAFNPASKALESEKIVGLANHTMLIAKDGSEYQIADSCAPIRDSEKNIKGVVLVFRDVTEEYRIEEELKQSEKKYRMFFENNDAIILLINPLNGEIIFTNKAAEKFYGYNHKQFAGMNFNSLNTLTSEDMEIKMGKARDTKQNLCILTHKLSDGTLRDVEIYQTKLTLGDNEVFSIIIHDITERIFAEKTLLQSEYRLLESQRVARLGYYVYNTNDGSWTSSTELDNIFGIDENFKRDIEGWQKLIHPEFEEEMKDYLVAHVLTKHKEFSKEYKIITLEKGDEKWVHCRGSLKFDEKNNPIEMFGTIQDITEKKMMIEQVIHSKEKAENANKMKSIFLAQMSHEIRTPINALVSMSSLLKYDFEENANEDQLMSFDIIDRAGDRIIRTVDLLLNLSEIQAGSYEINLTKFDLFADVISRIIAENKILAKRKNINFYSINSVENSELVADHYTVTQIFTQLIDNAIKYTKEGEISVRVLRNKYKCLVVEIKDTGIGIDEEYLPKIFEPFTQEEMGYTRKYEGNGIGLALVKKYCEFNTAIIEVESEKGVGSIFRVVFNI